MSNTLLPSIKIKGFFMDPSFYNVGWLMGLEPTTTGITIRDSTNWATATIRNEKIACIGKWIINLRYCLYGVPDRNRTCNPQLRRLVLYPVELRALSRAFLNTKALKNWSGWRDSNSRHPGPKPGALPDYATPRESRHYTFLGHKRQFLRLLQKTTINSVNKFDTRASPLEFLVVRFMHALL